jgi:hypothetical protein
MGYCITFSWNHPKLSVGVYFPWYKQ